MVKLSCDIFVIYCLFVVNVRVMGADTSAYVHIGYGNRHRTCCARGYRLGYGDFFINACMGMGL